jgi:hypothetical protein
MHCHIVLEDWNLARAFKALVKAALEATTTYEDAARLLGLSIPTLRRQIPRLELMREAAPHRLSKAKARPHRSTR